MINTDAFIRLGEAIMEATVGAFIDKLIAMDEQYKPNKFKRIFQDGSVDELSSFMNSLSPWQQRRFNKYAYVALEGRLEETRQEKVMLLLECPFLSAKPSKKLLNVLLDKFDDYCEANNVQMIDYLLNQSKFKSIFDERIKQIEQIDLYNFLVKCDWHGGMEVAEYLLRNKFSPSKREEAFLLACQKEGETIVDFFINKFDIPLSLELKENLKNQGCHDALMKLELRDLNSLLNQQLTVQDTKLRRVKI